MGTIAYFDAEGNRLKTTYLARMPEPRKVTLVAQLERELQSQRRNYPIGTGVTEAAAKTVVNVRMKRAGARFSQHGGQTVMLFRTAILSERFDLLHNELRATYMAQIAA